MTDIAQVQRFWDARPCNVQHSNHNIGTQAYFDEVEYRKFRAEPHILDFSEFSRWRGQRVLEIGCGIGTMAINFARFGARYTGVELSAASLDITRQRFEVYGLAADLYHGNAEELDQFLPPQQFDMVYSWGVIHHTPCPEHVIQQISRYLRPGGVLKIMVYAQHSWKNYMIKAGLDQPEAQTGCPIATTYTQDSVRDLVGPDYVIDSIQQDHIFPYEIGAYRQHQYVMQPWFDAMPHDLFRCLERNLGWHLLVTAQRRSAA